MIYETGTLVRHPLKPEWGPAKVLRVQGDKVHVLFRDLPDKEAKVINTSVIALVMAEMQSDPVLDNLPPLIEQGGKLLLPGKRHRLTASQTIEKFLKLFPQGFNDPRYFIEERDYKWAAHEKFKESLGDGKGRDLLDRGEITELAQRALAVCSKVNLLSPYENMAFHDALQNRPAAAHYFTALFNLLEAEKITKGILEPYLDAVIQLPREEGKARVATWPVTSLFPFLAQPDRHMFLKPGVTAEAAESLSFDLRYDPQPNWKTYESLLRMGSAYRELVHYLGLRDFIDVQSFIWVAGGGYK